MREAPLGRRLLAEFVGTGALVTVVVGSGIAAQRLSPDDAGLQLLENSLATVFGLGVLILLLGPVSGGHFNPVVSAADWLLGRRAGTGLAGRDVVSYIAAQTIGAVAGSVLANVMFDLHAVQVSGTDRVTMGHLIGEVVATAGLVALIFALARSVRPLSAVRGRGRCLHRCGVLVHQFHRLRQPGGHRRPGLLRHVRRHRPRVGARLRRGPGHRWRGRAGVGPRALPRRTGHGRRRRGPSRHRSHLRPSRRPGRSLMTDATIDAAMTDKPSVLFVCVHNAGRSQMSAGFARALGGDALTVRSAGSEPRDTVNPVAVAAMAEVGIDISAEVPKLLTADAVQASTTVFTMGCGDVCPVFPGTTYRDWDLPDPAGQGIEVVRTVRDEIRTRVQALLVEILPGHASVPTSESSAASTSPRGTGPTVSA